MKAGAIVLLVLTVIGAAFLLIYPWHRTVPTEAKQSTAPALTVEEQFFVQKAHDLIRSAIGLNQDAIEKGRRSVVRDFASKNLVEQERQLTMLRNTVSALDPDFIFTPTEIVEPRKNSRGAAFDEQYLQAFIEMQQQTLSVIARAESIKDPSLLRFTALWRSSINQAVAQAKSMKVELKNTAP